ncbi:MAG TPA: hypothetical protein VFH31_05010, partial [Pyrinomonadaceae bacterium]|nr:hypothetical protein [Pyrinomonadaceae bacterium]
MQRLHNAEVFEVHVINTWLQPGVRNRQQPENRLNGLPSVVSVNTWLKPGVNKKMKCQDKHPLHRKLERSLIL